MNSTRAPPTFTNATLQKPVPAEAGARGVEGLEHDLVPLERGLEVVDPVGDVRLGAQRARDRAVRLEAQELDVERVLARARHPHARRLHPALLRLLHGRDHPDVVELRAVELVVTPLWGGWWGRVVTPFGGGWWG
jgi:hypothetical protein